MDLSLKIPPHSQQAEEAVLSIVMRDPDALNDIEIPAEAFYNSHNRAIWEKIVEMAIAGETIDFLTVAEASGLSVDYFLKLNNSDHVRKNIVTYAEILNDAHQCRCEIDIYEQGLSDSYEGESSAAEIMGVLAGVAIKDETGSLEMHQHVQRFIEDCKEGKNGHFSWWCDEWTRKLGRMSSDLVILHAPRSTGKTAMMLQWIMETHKAGQVAPLASIEMLKKELAPRLLAHEGRLSTFTMRTRGHITRDEEERSISATERIQALNLRIRDKDMTIDDICTWAIREKSRTGAHAIFVDNLLSISDGGKRYDSKTIMYDSFIRKFRSLRDQLQIPIIILAHPNAEGGIAWSKDVENFADIILYLRDVPADGINFKSSGNTVHQRQLPGKHILAVIQKNRNGIYPVAASLNFIGETQTFEHIEWEDV